MASAFSLGQMMRVVAIEVSIYFYGKPCKMLNEPGHGFLFSMKDLDSSETLDRLIKTGVHTLKIEGRKKDAQYVTSVVKLYRKKLDEIFGRST